MYLIKLTCYNTSTEAKKFIYLKLLNGQLSVYIIKLLKSQNKSKFVK